MVTAHIRSLERQVGAKLLARDGRTVRLTEAGTLIYGWAKEMLHRAAELDRDLAGLAGGVSGGAVIAGSMTVGSYLLPPILAGFCAAHPEARLTLQVLDPDQVWDAVEQGTCDFAIAVAPRLQHDRSITGERIGTERLVAVAAPGDPIAERILTMTELAELRFVSTPAGSIRRLMEDEVFLSRGLRRTVISMEVGHPHAIKTAVRRGLGVAMLLHSSVADELADGTLREITITDAVLTYPIFAAWRHGKRLSPLHRALIAEITAACHTHGP